MRLHAANEAVESQRVIVEGHKVSKSGRRWSMLFTTVLMGLSGSLSAWNEAGHVVIAEVALKSVGENAQRIEKIAATLATQFPIEKRGYLISTYDKISYLGQISAFPDTVRNMTLRDVYATYGETMPAVLERYADDTTSQWHYINHSYIQNDFRQECLLTGDVNLVSVIPDLITAFHQSTSDKDKAIALSFLVHLIGDSAQPLHTFTRVYFNCNHDRGGNDFCVATRTSEEHCKKNLHQLWDEAVGLFDQKQTLAERVAIIGSTPVSSEIANQGTPEEWVKHGPEQARFIYSLTINRDPDAFYLEEGQFYAQQYLARGAAWLSDILQQLNQPQR